MELVWLLLGLAVAAAVTAYLIFVRPEKDRLTREAKAKQQMLSRMIGDKTPTF